MSTRSVAEKLLIKPNTTALVFADDAASLRFRPLTEGEAPFTRGRS
jgi:hypothetical protein